MTHDVCGPYGGEKPDNVDSTDSVDIRTGLDRVVDWQPLRTCKKATVTEPVRVPLTQGQFALIDARDYPVVAQYRWSALRSGNTWYAKARVNGKTTYMHRLIVFGPEKSAESSLKVDHINRNGLDNTRDNLRPVTHSQNMMNTCGRPSARRSRFKGVSVRKHSHKRYRATIHVGGKQKHLGNFNLEYRAACVYDDAARLHFGAHARLNFPYRGLIKHDPLVYRVYRVANPTPLPSMCRLKAA